MSAKRILKLSNIRANPRFTGQYDAKYYYSNYANASGPHPGEFNLTAYNALINDSNATLDVVTKALDEVKAFETEYNRQAQHHTNRGDKPNADVAFGWRDTAFKVKQELESKRNKLIATQNTPPPTNTNNPPVSTMLPTAWSTKKIAFVTIGSVAAVTGIILAVKFFKNRGK